MDSAPSTALPTAPAAAPIVGSSPDADRNRAPDGLARRLDEGGVVRRSTPSAVDPTTEAQAGHLIAAIVGRRPQRRARRPGIGRDGDEWRLIALGGGMSDDPLLPLGLDSHRYRCCGNGVVAPVAEWLGARLAEALA
jgi:site-specific DNA-cytosine methylase